MLLRDHANFHGRNAGGLEITGTFPAYSQHVSDRAHRLWLAALLIAASTVGYLAIGTHHQAHASRIAPLALVTPLDARIPFMPWFVFAYLLYYVWLIIPLVVIRRAEQLDRVIAAFTLMQVSAALVFFTFPSRMNRPTDLPDDLAGTTLRSLYAVDPGWNLFPSLHVGHSVLVALLCWRYRRDLFPVVAAGAAVIAASTVLIKQHYVIDIPAGALLAGACMATVTHWRRLKMRSERAEAPRWFSP
jgi:membrane-associated phospholipid phosphatase